MALKYFLEHSLWHKAYAATWRKSYGQQVKQSLILDECQRFSSSSPAIPSFINNTKTWTLQALSCIELQKIGSALLKKAWQQSHFYQLSGFTYTENWGVTENVVFCTSKLWACIFYLCWPTLSQAIPWHTSAVIFQGPMWLQDLVQHSQFWGLKCLLAQVCLTLYHLLSLASRNHV